MTHESPDRRPAVYHNLHHSKMLQQEEANRYSAQAILSLLFRHYLPKSVLDVGCGLGTWLEVGGSWGVSDVLGIEGPWLDRGLLRVPQELV